MNDTVAAGEFQRLPDQRPLFATQIEEIEKLELRFALVGTELAAAELIGARLIAGETGGLDLPAKLLANSDNPTYRRLAARLHRSDQSATTPESLPATAPSVESMFHSRIAWAKRRASTDPRSPIAWADLARLYVGVGQFEQARRALRIARYLAPDSRYLLRVTTRFHLHVGDDRAAVAVLKASPRTLEDPWLLSALMAASTLAGAPLPGRRVAQRILDGGRFREIETSELVAELGTLELSSGGDKKARELLQRSLAAPTDNSLAQGQWLAPKLPSLEVPLSLEVAFPAEATAWKASSRGDWEVALDESSKWLADQPFDAEAATHASYVAAVGMDRFEDSLRFAEIGLVANPHHATLANNRAYALTELGRLDEAELALRDVLARAEKVDLVAVLATAGLISFRRGDSTTGRQLYGRAIENAHRLGEKRSEAMARAMLVREELALNAVDVVPQMAALDRLVPSIDDAGVLRCVSRVRNALAGRAAVESR